MATRQLTPFSERFTLNLVSVVSSAKIAFAQKSNLQPCLRTLFDQTPSTYHSRVFQILGECASAHYKLFNAESIKTTFLEYYPPFLLTPYLSSSPEGFVLFAVLFCAQYRKIVLIPSSFRSPLSYS